MRLQSITSTKIEAASCLRLRWDVEYIVHVLCCIGSCCFEKVSRRHTYGGFSVLCRGGGRRESEKVVQEIVLYVGEEPLFCATRRHCIYTLKHPLCGIGVCVR